VELSKGLPDTFRNASPSGISRDFPKKIVAPQTARERMHQRLELQSIHDLRELHLRLLAMN
jgi:hypothetical protein